MNNIEILENKIQCFRHLQNTLDDDEKELFEDGIQQKEIEAIENLIQENKELKEKQKEYEKQLDLDYVKENYIPKSIADYLEEGKDRLGKLYYEANEARIKYEKRIKKAINYINIDKEIEECCSIVDVNGIELLKILRGEK